MTTMELPQDLDEMARTVIDTNRYMVLGTIDDDHRPRVSPVYFTHVAYRTFYWVSSPAARHSANVTARPEVAMVIYGSSAPIGYGRAVYVDAMAAIVTDDELPQACAEAYAHIGEGAKAFQPHELSGPAAIRLYRAHATNLDVHVPGRDPAYGTGIDKRRAVNP